jgi:hypothetical protein
MFTAYGFPVGHSYIAAGYCHRQTDGIETADASGQSLGRAAFSDQSMILSIADAAYLPLGMNIKRVDSRFSRYNVSGIGIDLGLQGSRGPWRLGMEWKDVGGTTLSGDSYYGGSARTRLPARARMGFAYSGLPPSEESTQAPLWAGVLATDVQFPLQGDEGAEYFFGGEVWSQGRLAFRGGWSADHGWSTGISVNLSRVRIDAALRLSDDASSLIRVTTHVFFGYAGEDRS